MVQKKTLKKNWTSLDLDESLASSSSSCRVLVKKCAPWHALDLEDDVDVGDAPAPVKKPTTQPTTKRWRTLDLDELEASAEPERPRRWQSLSIDE